MFHILLRQDDAATCGKKQARNVNRIQACNHGPAVYNPNQNEGSRTPKLPELKLYLIHKRGDGEVRQYFLGNVKSPVQARKLGDKALRRLYIDQPVELEYLERQPTLDQIKRYPKLIVIPM